MELSSNYMQEYLDEYVGSCKRRNILYQVSRMLLLNLGLKSVVCVNFYLGKVFIFFVET